MYIQRGNAGVVVQALEQPIHDILTPHIVPHEQGFQNLVAHNQLLQKRRQLTIILCARVRERAQQKSSGHGLEERHSIQKSHFRDAVPSKGSGFCVGLFCTCRNGAPRRWKVDGLGVRITGAVRNQAIQIVHSGFLWEDGRHQRYSNSQSMHKAGANLMDLGVSLPSHI